MRTLLAVVTLAAALAAACGDDDRPSAAAWAQRWDDTRALVPEASVIGSDAGVDRCGEFLGEIRSRREELLPAPSDAVGDAFTAWMEAAQAIGLECGDTDDLDERLSELDEIGDRIDILLEGGA